MKVKTFYGNIYEINPEELYIKPFYNGKDVIYYAVCSNLNNEEVELATFTDIKEIKGISCAKQSIKILLWHKEDTEIFPIFSQQEITQLREYTDRISRAIKTSK